MTAPRSVGLLGATGIGVGSMLGAGVFVVWGPALHAAGTLIAVAVLVAGAAATVNALSSAQLAARYPQAGGAYTYGREELGGTAGFVAGAAFVAGKTASVAAVALAIGHYTWSSHPAVVATVAITASWALNARGVTRTAAVATAMSAAVLLGLGAVMFAVLGAGPPDDAQSGVLDMSDAPRFGVLSAAALIFFAFAGYARVATLGEEVREPARTIPRAIALSLAVVGALYLLIALAFRSAWAMPVSGTTGVPLEALASQVRGGGVVVSILAPVAAAGALVSLMAGIGRTAMAMARHSDLPRLLARQGATGAPWIAEGASALVSVALAWAGDLALALATSACCVLVYYAIANLAAVRQSLAHRTVSWRLPPVVSMLGAVLCGILAVSLPLVAVLAAAGALGAALLIRAVLGPALR